MNEEDIKNKLSEQEYNVLRKGGTEAPFTGEYVNDKRTGAYMCKVCGAPLFSSDTKFDSGTGWPSFDQALPRAIEYVEDKAHGMNRTEARCAQCHSHLGHVFPDGPTDTGKRYCINSVCLVHEADKKDTE